jgi:hypothetical protein
VWRPPLGVGLVQGNDDKTLDAIKIEIHERVESRELRALYLEALDLYGLPYARGHGDIRWASVGDSLQMVVRPEDDTILHPILKFTISDRLQAPFAHPADVAAEYDARKDQRYLKGPGGGTSVKYYNAIPAVVAWYLSEKMLLESSEDERSKITRLVGACLEEPRKKCMPKLERRLQPKQTLEPILPHIEQTEDELGLRTDLNNPYGWVHKTF